MGIVSSYLVFNEAIFSKNVKDAKMALAAAETGAQRAMARLLQKNLNANFSGTLDGAQYSVSFRQITQNGLEEAWEIVSYGTYNDASKRLRIQIVVEKRAPFKPFASDGQFSVNMINIANEFDKLLEIWATKGFNINQATGIDEKQINNLLYGENLVVNKWNVKLVHEKTPTPSIKNISFNIADYSDQCDVGDNTFLSNVNISDVSVSDVNGDGKIVICGKNVNIDANILVSTDAFVVLAQNINVNAKIDEHGSNSLFNVILIAEDDVILGDKAEVEHHGKANTYNITIYAGDQIGVDSDHFIYVTGFSTAEEEANILLVSGKGIDAPDANIHYTGKESNNLLIWSDGDITLGRWDITEPSGDEVRKVGIIAHSDDPNVDPSNIKFTGKILINGSHRIEGLTVEDIQKWYDKLPDDNPTKAILAALLRQLADAGANLPPALKRIDYWRVE